MFICLEKIKAPTTTFYMSDVAFAHFPLKAFVTSADGPKRSLWWSPDRLFWVFTPEFIYKQSGRSPGGAWWFLTSRQADVQRAWIKHMASSDHGLQAFQESNEIWAVISIHKKKNPYPFVRFLWCSIKYVWHFCGLTWVAKQLWQSKPRQVCQSGGWEGEWMGPSLPAGNINRSIMWPVTSVYQLMKHRARWVEVGRMAFSHLPLFEMWSVSFSSSQRRPDSTVQLSGGGGDRMRYHTAHSKLVQHCI